MAGKNVHVVPSDGRWAVKLEGQKTHLSQHRTQTAAENAGRPVARAQRSELVTHRADGRIRDKDSYGHDPASRKDTKH